MTIQEAIKKANEQSYSSVQIVGRAWIAHDPILALDEKFGRTWEEEKTIAIVLLDPTFWQSLGKAQGWRDYCNSDLCRECGTKYSPMSGWQAYWHRFIDHLADGKTAKSFFEALL
jgi:hypothetical protein